MLKVLAIASSLALAACASATRGSRCAPIDPEMYLEYGGLYDECTVDRAARVVFRPRIEVNYTPPVNVICAIVELRGIVDTSGKVIPETVEIRLTNDGQYAELVMSKLNQFRFSPGRAKNGRAVHQITRFDSKTQVRFPVSIQGQATRQSSVSC